MNLQEIRDYVREHMDLEEEDLPNDVIDRFIREGSKKIETSEQRWPFYEASFTYQTVAGTGSVELGSIGGNLKRIASILYDGKPLEWVSIDEYDDIWAAKSGEPKKYAEWGGAILLGPVPDSAYDLTVRGYRSQSDWIAEGAGAVPDMPEVLHNTVANWVLYRSYAQQEDPELAHLYRELFDTELNEVGRRLTELSLHRPFILNRVDQTERAPNPYRYDLPW